jgi:hypothetical protein
MNSKFKSRIEDRFGRGKAAGWKHGDFEQLSDEIYESTHQRISSKTLKRIFGKEKTDKDYQPQEETFRILLEYAGIEKKTVKTPVKKRCIVIITVLAILGIVMTSLPFMFKSVPEAKIENVYTEGETPTTAWFKVSAKPSRDSLFVDFGDQTPWKHLGSNDTLFSHLYVYPDRFDVTVRTRKQVVSDTISVVCKTNGWTVIGFDDHNRIKAYPIPFYSCIDSGYFHPTNDLLNACGINTNKFFLSGLYNYKDFGISGDSFTLKSRLKSTIFWPEVQCKGLVIWIKCEHGAIKQHFNAPGCSYWLNPIYSEVDVKGQSENLSQFSVDFTRWRSITIENREKNLSIYVDNSQIYNVAYRRNLGDIIGISFNFLGSGYVDYCKLTDANGKDIINDTFEN